MRDLIINPEFRDIIPPLLEDEFKKLEENILADGEVREPLVVWNNTIIDGHNRYKILQKHPEIKMPQIKEMDFPDKWAAIVWMCNNQFGRRNLTWVQRAELVAQQYEAQKKTIGAPSCNKNASSKQSLNSSGIVVKSRGTAEVVARQIGASWGYVEKSSQFSKGLSAADEVSPGFRDDVLSGKIKVKHKDIREIRNLQTDDQKREAIERIKSGDPISTIRKPPSAPTERRYNGGGAKEYRETRESIEEIAADMYDADKPVEYSINDLVEEIRVNAEAYVKQLSRTLEIRSSLLTGENRQIVMDAVEEHVLQKLRKVAGLLK